MVASLRDDTIVKNMRLVNKFVARLPPIAVSRAGGHDAAVSALTPNYIVAVDAWLDRGQTKGRALSTFVWKNLGHAWRRLLAYETNVVKIPVKHLQTCTVATYQIEDDSPEPMAPEPEETLEAEEVEQLLSAIDTLPPRERIVVRNRLLRDPRTLEEIGEAIGVCKERVRQIYAKGIEKLARLYRRNSN